jgi:hypothetical protein
MTRTPSVDDLAQLGFKQACDEVKEIMGGKDPLYMTDLTACEMVALLTILRPAHERRRQPAPVLTLVPRHGDGGGVAPSIPVRAGYGSAPTNCTSPA